MPLDVTGYIPAGDLLPATVDELVQQAIADAKAGKWPDWIPREGQQEVILLELMAGMAAEDTSRLNELTGAVAEIILRFYGLTRSLGTTATVNVRFTVTAAPGSVVIPAGSLVVLDPSQGIDPVTFSTDTTLTIPSGSSTGVVGATALRVGSEFNGILAGVTVQVLSALPFVDSAVTTSEVVGGTDPEDSVTFLDRAAPRLSRLVETLVTVNQFTAAALETVGVERAITLDQYNSDAGGAVGSTPGHVTVAVAGPNGSTLSQSALDALETTLQSMAYIMLTVHTINANLVLVDVSVTVTALPGYTQAEVQGFVTNAVDAYLNPDTWAWGSSVARNEIIALVDGALGVDRVVNVTKLGTNTDGSDYTLPGVAPLAKAGTVTVTVTS